MKIGNRILVLGSPGSGKSTLARRLGMVSGLPIVHLDREFWKPGWQQPAQEEWEATVRRLVQEKRWIMDGNYADTLSIRLERADTAIYLDLPRLACLRSLVARRFTYRSKERPDMAPGCPEKLNVKFLVWTWKFRKKIRPATLAQLEASDARLIVLKTRREATEFLASLE